MLAFWGGGFKGRQQSENNGYIRVKQTAVMDSFVQELQNKKYFYSQNTFNTYKRILSKLRSWKE